jgi:hypothetical protein
MTSITETQAAAPVARACPPSAVVDQIVRWEAVQAGDLVLWDGELWPVEWNIPYSKQAGMRLIMLPCLPVAGVIPCGTYAAVRRYTEGISEDDSLILAALDEAADDRDERASRVCFDCTETGDGPCPDQREHLDRASQYRELRDRREAGR